MKKLIWLVLPLIVAGCSSSNIDLTNPNNYGLKCSPNASTLPDWRKCIENANKICGAQRAVNIQQHNPTGSGEMGDSYFINFQCGN